MAPTVDLAGDNAVDLGSAYTLALSNLVDPGTDTVTEYQIDWDDGSTQTVAGLGDYDHDYVDSGDYAVTIRLTDEDGTYDFTRPVSVVGPSVTPVIDVDDLVVDEGAGLAEFVVRLSAPSAQAVSVSYATAPGTASTSDFVDIGTERLTFAAGETTKTVRISLTEDTNVEADEVFYFNLFSPVNGLVGRTEVTATIIDNDDAPGTPVLTVSNPVVDETIGEAVFVLRLDGPSTGTITVDYATEADTAEASDYTPVSGTASFGPGEVVQYVRVPITDDAVAEGIERFDLVLSNVSGATLPTGRGTATIDASDQSTAALPLINVDDLVVDEGAGFAEFVVRLSAPSVQAVSVSYATAPGTASTSDFVDIGTERLTFAAGETTKTVRIGLTEDTNVEADEVFYFNLFSPVNGLVGRTEVTATIIDNDDAPGTPVLTVSNPVVDEMIGEAVFVLRLDGPGTGTITVDYATVADTADASDYTPVSGTASFGLGEVVQYVRVPITDDAVAEGIERFDLVLSNVSGATLPTGRGTATIDASDQSTAALPLINVDDLVVDEGAGFAEFVVRLSAPSAQAVSVSYATAPGTASTSDFVDIGTERLTFAAGETTKTVRIGLTEDTNVEADEVFYFNLFSPVNGLVGRTEVTATIIDNDDAPGTPVLTVSNPVVDETIGEAVFVLRLDGPSTGTITVDYATEADTADASDYTPVSGTASFAPGEVVQSVRVPITDDAVAEGIERFDLVLSNVSGATLPTDRGAATIDASDQSTAALPLIDVDDLVVDEGAGFAEFVVRLSAPSAQAVSVSYATAPGTASTSDFVDIGTERLTFAAGETLKTVRVSIVDDLVAEPDEAFLLQLFSAENATINRSTVTGTIRDNDGGGAPDLSVNPLMSESVAEGGAVNKTVTFSDTDDTDNDGWTYDIDWDNDGTVDESGSVVAGGPLSFDISQSYPDGPATSTVAVTVTDGAGESDTATFEVTVNNVEPTLGLLGADEVDEDSTYTLTLANLVDPGDDTVTNYDIDWGDGSTIQAVKALGDVDHIYADDGDVTITVTVTDDDGSYDFIKQLTVNPQQPDVSVNAGGPAVLAEGETLNRTITFTDAEDTEGDGWTYDIDWDNDGTVDESGSVVAGGPLSFDISQSYPDGPATSTVAVTVNDGAGESDTATFDVTVENVASTLDLLGDDSTDEGSTYTLTLANLVDPGDDTVSSYEIDWGDGGSETVNSLGDVTHVYADNADVTITVTATDEDGSYTFTNSLTVNNVAPALLLALDQTTIDEGEAVVLTITGSDPAGAADPLSYDIDWGDGSAAQTVLASSLTNGQISHTYADDEDGPINETDYSISVTASDGDGGTATADATVTVVNVDPMLDLHGADDVDEGAIYTLSLASLVDPGEDTVSSYVIDWGDGSGETTVDALGDVTHTYADGPADRTISVVATDEDGSYSFTKSLTVNPRPDGVSVNVGGPASVDEGETFNRTISFTDSDDANGDGWTYEVDWDNDGTADETGTIAASESSFDISRFYPDGPANASVGVKVIDQPGSDEGAASFNVTVSNVAPILDLLGADEVDEGATYTLSLANLVDPGQDIVTAYAIDWGDGASDTANALGDVTHTYADGPADRTISVVATDEDGSYTFTTSVMVNDTVSPEVVRIGDAPVRQLRSEPTAWEDAWTGADVQISHRADVTDDNEPWSDILFSNRSTHLLSGGDILSGDLGVSGQSWASGFRQEIDGNEALRFDFAQTATRVTADIAQLLTDDDGNLNEAGRLQALDDNDNIVGEVTFVAASDNGEQQAILEVAGGFSAVVLTAGAYDGSSFEFGAYGDDDGEFAAQRSIDNGVAHGSDFILDAIEFEFISAATSAAAASVPPPAAVASSGSVSPQRADSLADLAIDDDPASLIGVQQDDGLGLV